MAMKGFQKENLRKWMLPAILVGLLILVVLNMMKRSDTMRVHVVFPDGGGVLADVADSPEEHLLALFVADRLKEGQGVLLMYEESGLHGLWTRNVQSPVDLIWIDPMHEIVRVEENVSPCREETCPTLRPERAVLFLLETPPGVAARHGLQNGMTLDFQRVASQ
jgi:uncharacterized membrane protein (UPF0127 family)